MLASKMKLCMTSVAAATSSAPFSTGKFLSASLKYRLDYNLEKFGPLSATPDWSFADGRKRALNPREKQKKDEQIELARQIVSGLKDQRAAKEEFQRHLVESAQQRAALLAKKPKAKGSRLKATTNSSQT